MVRGCRGTVADSTLRHEHVELSLPTNLPQDVLSYLEIVPANGAEAALDGSLCEEMTERITRTPKKFARVVSELPVKVGADAHLAPRIMVKDS